MPKYWYITFPYPLTLPTTPLNFLDENFNTLFIRTRVCDELDDFIMNIKRQYGKFWVSSQRGGLGKSTILNYICRRLFSSFDKLRALPFLISLRAPYRSIEHAFIREFIESFLRLGDVLIDVRDRLRVEIPRDVEEVIISDFRQYRGDIEDLLNKLPELDVSRLDISYFRKVLDACLKKWYEKDGVISKYVLLIDEMDKLDPREVLDFLSRNQKLFELLYDEYGFVTFFAGHRPWVEIIHGSTEYSFFKGKIFELYPFMDLDDVKALIETRLIVYAHMNRYDIPFSKEAYERIRDLTSGSPREILLLVSEVLNKAYSKKMSSIGPGFIEEVSGRIYEGRVIEYLQSTTYEKLKKAVEKRLYYLIDIFYDYSIRHEIPKSFDDDFNARVKYLGLELSDKDWHEVIETLVRLECVVDKGSVWALTGDIVKFLDKLNEHNIPRKIIPSIIREVRVKPVIEEIPVPNFEVAIERPFKANPSKWYTKNEIFNWFKDTTSVVMFIKDKYPGLSYERVAEEIFEKEFKNYLKKKKKEIMVIGKYYRKIPEAVNIDEYRILKKLGSREIIDEYVTLLVEKKSYDFQSIANIDSLIENLLSKIGELQGITVKTGILRKRTQRYRLFKSLGLPDKLKKRVSSYIDETSDTSYYDSDLIKNIARRIVMELAKIIVDLKKRIKRERAEILIEPGKPLTNLKKISDLFKILKGRVLILDKHLDKEGLLVLGEIEAKNVREIQILIGTEKLSANLKKYFKAFIDEMRNKGITVSVRVLDPNDEKIFTTGI